MLLLQVKKIVPFSGELDIKAVPLDDQDGQAAVNKISMVLNGYEMDFERTVQKLFTAFDSADAVVAEVM